LAGSSRTAAELPLVVPDDHRHDPAVDSPARTALIERYKAGYAFEHADQIPRARLGASVRP